MCSGEPKDLVSERCHAGTPHPGVGRQIDSLKHAAAVATTARGPVHCGEPRAGEAVSGVELSYLTFLVCHLGPPQKAAVPPLGPVWPIVRILAWESGLRILPLV